MDNNPITPIPIFVSFSRIVINRDVVHQQEQPSDITMNINNHINYYSFPPSPPPPAPPAPPQLVPDDNHIQSTTMNKDIQTEYQEEEEEHTDEDDDNKTITEHESNDSDHDSIYQTPPTSDNDNEDDNLD